MTRAYAVVGPDGIAAIYLSESMAQRQALSHEKVVKARVSTAVECRWWQDGTEGYWQPGCGAQPWEFPDGGPDDNGVKCCFNCGAPVVVEGE